MSCAVLDIHACRSGQTDYTACNIQYYIIHAKTNPRDPPATCRPAQRKTENCQSNSLGAHG